MTMQNEQAISYHMRQLSFYDAASNYHKFTIGHGERLERFAQPALQSCRHCGDYYARKLVAAVESQQLHSLIMFA